MTKGLVRANNFSDLADKDQAVVNLGLSSADYAALKGLYATAGIDFAVIGEIGNSQGNYQAQLDGLTTTFSGVALSGYVNRSGNSSIIGKWTHGGGYISVNNGLPSGYPASTDSLFSLSIESGEAVIVASGLVASGLSYNGVRQSNSTVTQASLRNGFSPLHLIPLQVGGQAYFAQAGETPSFYIAPGRTGHALELITGTVMGGGTVNCASPAWEVGPDGILYQPAANTPVIGYDPVTLRPRGLRVWGAVTNLWLYTSAIGTAPWSSVRSTSTLNAAISPDGTLTATRLNEDTSASTSHLVRQDPLVSSGTTYCWSVFAKASTRSELIMAFGVDSGAFAGEYATFNLSTGQITASEATTTARISTFPNGWYRCSVTATALASTYAVLRHHIAVNGSAAYTGDGTSSLLLWGAQLQTGSTVGPYVPTTTTTASSTADVISIAGADAARIINTAQGTLYVDFATGSAVPASTYPTMLQLQGANRQNEVQIYASTGIVAYLVKTGNVVQAEANLSAATQNGVKSAFRYAENNSRSYVNGSPLFLDTVCTMPATDRIFIGSSNGSEYFLNGYIREAAILRTGRADANLQAMTQ